ncbi:MAG: AraC family transcriptional regulator [Elainellaceae cyanobacterium]
MTANSHRSAQQNMADQDEHLRKRGFDPDGEAERSNPSLQRMWEIVRNRPYAVLEASAGDARVDTIQVATWRNHLLECSCAEKLADHTISLQLSGQPVKRIDKKKPGVVPGRFVILPAQSVSAWQSEGETRFAHLYFTPEFLSQLAASAFDADPDRFELIEGELIQDQQVQRLAASAIELFSRTDRPLPLETNSLAQVLGVHLIRHYSNLFSKPEPFNRERLSAAQLEAVVEYIDANLGRSLTVQELADLLHLSQYHFLRAFRNTLNQTPRRYVLQRRVTKAQDLIRQGKLSLADIAYQLGFSSQSHLSTAFKQVTGTTPSQFQRLI